MKKHYILILFMVVFFAGCVQNQPVYDYSNLQQTKPKSILIVMPTNDSMEIKGSAAILSNAVKPLSELGYYVFPVALVNDTFKHNGITEAFDIHQISLHKLKDIFGADAVLYINVQEYGSNYVVVNTSVKISVDAKLVDINSGNILWQKSQTTVENSSGNNGDLLSMVVSAVVSQVLNSVTDNAYELSKIADAQLFAPNCNDCLLFGPYSPYYNQDKQLNLD